MSCLYLRSLKHALALMAIGALIVGCGNSASADNEGGEGYGEILHGLRKAARAHVGYGDYDAVGRAKDLKPTLRASLDAFCEVAQEMVVNEEAWKAANTPYYVTRIKLRAERELPFVSTRPVNVAVTELADVFNLSSFDAGDVRSYVKACYHREFWY
jgi:hypothetical protein